MTRTILRSPPTSARRALRDGEQARVSYAPQHLVAGAPHAVHIEYRATRPLTNLQLGTLLLQWKTPPGVQSPDIAQAVAAARDARVAVVYARDFETEERDRVSLKLPQSADQLISAVSAVNPNTVVVLATGGPVTMPWLGSVAAVVQTYFGGQEQGSALPAYTGCTSGRPNGTHRSRGRSPSGRRARYRPRRFHGAAVVRAAAAAQTRSLPRGS